MGVMDFLLLIVFGVLMAYGMSQTPSPKSRKAAKASEGKNRRRENNGRWR